MKVHETFEDIFFDQSQSEQNLFFEIKGCVYLNRKCQNKHKSFFSPYKVLFTSAYFKDHR